MHRQSIAWRALAEEGDCETLRDVDEHDGKPCFFYNRIEHSGVIGYCENGEWKRKRIEPDSVTHRCRLRCDALCVHVVDDTPNIDDVFFGLILKSYGRVPK